MPSHYLNQWLPSSLIHIHVSPGAHFTNDFVHRNSNPMETWNYCNSTVGYHNTTKFCTCHDRTAVVPCAKYNSDHFTITWMKAEWNFHWIWIAKEKFFAKWAHGLTCVITNLVIHTLEVNHKICQHMAWSNCIYLQSTTWEIHHVHFTYRIIDTNTQFQPNMHISSCTRRVLAMPPAWAVE